MRRVGVIGAGESGVGAAMLALTVGDVPFLSEYGQVAEPYRQKLIENKILFEEGGHSFDRLSESDVIVKSPGVPDHVPVVRHMLEQGIEVISELEYAYRHRHQEAKIIAITGSNGKTTTTNLVHHLLDTAGLSSTKGGNLGICFSNLLLGPKSEVYVLEVSSFQLDGIKDFRPDIAVLLNITPDHLDRYDYDFLLYAKSKMRIAENLKSGDRFIYNGDDETISGLMDRHVSAAGLIAIKRDELRVADFHLDNLALRGEHNAMNASFAIEVARHLGVADDKIQLGLNDFANDDHRMQVVGVINGVEWINDSKATNVDATYYALKAMTKPVIWIVGGTDKGNDYSQILPIVVDKVRHIVALGVDNGPIHEAFGGRDIPISNVGSMKAALHAAESLSQEGDAVLLSPACASFDLFKNYKDRGDQFVAGVWRLLRDKASG